MAMQAMISAIVILVLTASLGEATCPLGSKPCGRRHNCTPLGGSCIKRHCVNEQGQRVPCMRLKTTVTRDVQRVQQKHVASPPASVAGMSSKPISGSRLDDIPLDITETSTGIRGARQVSSSSSKATHGTQPITTHVHASISPHAGSASANRNARKLHQTAGLGNLAVGLSREMTYRGNNMGAIASQMYNFYGPDGAGIRSRAGMMPAPGGLAVMALAGPQHMPGPAGMTFGWIGQNIEYAATEALPLAALAAGTAAVKTVVGAALGGGTTDLSAMASGLDTSVMMPNTGAMNPMSQIVGIAVEAVGNKLTEIGAKKAAKKAERENKSKNKNKGWFGGKKMTNKTVEAHAAETVVTSNSMGPGQIMPGAASSGVYAAGNIAGAASATASAAGGGVGYVTGANGRQYVVENSGSQYRPGIPASTGLGAGQYMHAASTQAGMVAGSTTSQYNPAPTGSGTDGMDGSTDDFSIPDDGSNLGSMYTAQETYDDDDGYMPTNPAPTYVPGSSNMDTGYADTNYAGVPSQASKQYTLPQQSGIFAQGGSSIIRPSSGNGVVAVGGPYDDVDDAFSTQNRGK